MIKQQAALRMQPMMQPMMQPIMPPGYYQPGMGGMMPAQQWGAPQQQQFVKSSTATRQSAQKIRKRSDGKKLKSNIVIIICTTFFRPQKIRG